MQHKISSLMFHIQLPSASHQHRSFSSTKQSYQRLITLRITWTTSTFKRTMNNFNFVPGLNVSLQLPLSVHLSPTGNRPCIEEQRISSRHHDWMFCKTKSWLALACWASHLAVHKFPWILHSWPVGTSSSRQIWLELSVHHTIQAVYLTNLHKQWIFIC